MNTPIIVQKAPFIQKLELGTCYYYSCGKSKNQSYFCDSSHIGT